MTNTQMNQKEQEKELQNTKSHIRCAREVKNLYNTGF